MTRQTSVKRQECKTPVNDEASVRTKVVYMKEYFRSVRSEGTLLPHVLIWRAKVLGYSS